MSQRIFPWFNEEECEGEIIKAVKQGEQVVSLNNHIYIRNGHLFFPCVKLSRNEYLIKSILTWEMVKEQMNRIKRLQEKNISKKKEA